MSNEKTNKNWGGARKDAGRPEGKTKAKICVSVNEAVWQAAVSAWNGKPSHLVENLLCDYVAGGGITSEMGAL